MHYKYKNIMFDENSEYTYGINTYSPEGRIY